MAEEQTKQKSILIADLALRKGWTKIPGYWIRLYCWERNGIGFFAVVREWRFKKNNEMVEGTTQSPKFTVVKEAVDLFLDYALDKIVQGAYLKHELSLNDNINVKNTDIQIVKDRISKGVANCVKAQTAIEAKHKTEMVAAHPTPTATPKKVKTAPPKESKFKEAWDRRKRNCEW